MDIIFGREEKMAILLLLTVVVISCIICFVLEDIGKYSFASPYGPSSEPGDLVFYEGIVDEIIYTNTGGHIIVKSEDTIIFIRKGAMNEINPKPGMQIQATGTIEIYKEEEEILVEGPGDVTFTVLTE